MKNVTCGLKRHGKAVKGKYMYVLFTWREVRKVTNCVRVLYLLVIAFVLSDQMLEGSRGDLCPLMKWYERNLCGKYCRITIPSSYPLLLCYSIYVSILERTNLILQIQRTFDISFSVSPNSINCLCTCVIAQNALDFCTKTLRAKDSLNTVVFEVI